MLLIFFFFNDTATTEIYTLSLHDALPISGPIDPEPVSRRFIEHYAASVPWTVDGPSLGWYARTSILRKLHGAVKRLARPTLARLESHGEALVERWNSIPAWAPRAR